MPMNGATMPAEAVDEQVAAEQRGRRHRPVADAAQGQGDQGDDDEGVEDHRREDRAGGEASRMMLSRSSTG